VKNFVLLILVFVFGVIASTSVSAQEPIAEAPPSVQTLVHQEQEQTSVATLALSQSCENCTGSSVATTMISTPVKFIQRLACSSPVQRVAQAPSRFGHWVQCNKPVRSAMRNVACRLRCR
jgi:hypothetical protein